MSDLFANPLEEMIEFQDLKTDLQRGQGPLLVTGCLDSQKVHLLSELSDLTPWKLIVTYDDSRAREICEDYRCFDTDISLYPARDLLFYTSDIHGNLLTKQRIQVMRRVLESSGGVVVTTIDGLMEHLLPLAWMKERSLTIGAEDVVEVGKLTHALAEMGYEKVAQVEGSGQFSVRGGIIDIFPLTEEVPYRIELWGDEVDSIRTFDPESQRSIEQVDEAVIYPATEMALTPEQIQDGTEAIEKDRRKYVKKLRDAMKTEEAYRMDSAVSEVLEGLREGFRVHGLGSYIRYFCKETVSFLNYFPVDELTIFLDEPLRLKEKAETTETEFRESMSHRLEGGYLLPGQTSFLYSAKETLAMAMRPRTLLLLGLDQKLSGMTVKKKYSLSVKNVNSYQNGFELLISDLARWKKEKYRVVLLAGSRTRASRLAGDLREYDLSAFCPDEGENTVKPGEILVTYGKLHRGFEYPLIKFVVITEGDMFGGGRGRKKKKKTSYQGKKIQSFSELSIGDYVVHESHGLGIYRGIEKIEQDKVVKDYIKIEYRDGGNLYLPATRLEGIQKYAGSDARTPKLNKLGGMEWNKTKSKVRGAVRDIAKDLVELYAARQRSEGYQYGPDTVWQREFEEMFPFEETEDQLEAIEATKKDMESRRIMDRLICGDVGYGKTEIALRAAFKAIQEGKQVVYLVPTTILAQQHYNTFVQRMKDFPVRVDMLSRFRTAGEQKKTLEDLKKGQVDVVIGTHRVLSKDVVFKNLGLLIIDEEQRFGVAQKEKIKKWHLGIDVLSLSATPIPRTLHMALVNGRDMSVIESPPEDRLPVETYVSEYNDGMIKEALERELRRGGRIYYISNRVSALEPLAAKLRRLVPGISIKIAHGQMNEDALEDAMITFYEGGCDVLLCTTIVENGLDVPLANTIIIDGADNFGLSQLYQMRGRVGRSSRLAYAYFVYQPNKALSEIAEKRLQAIRDFTELGAGFKIAMRDLEIRGAGNLLGPQQHGHITGIGFAAYCEMLEKTIERLKNGKEAEPEPEPVLEIQAEAYIPDSYIPDPRYKMELYRRFSELEYSQREDFLDEIIDRFGNPPPEVEMLWRLAALKGLCRVLKIRGVNVHQGIIRLTFGEKAQVNPEAVLKLLMQHPKTMTLKNGQEQQLTYRMGTSKQEPLAWLEQTLPALILED